MRESAKVWSENSETRKHILRFLVIGCLSVLMDALIYYVLTNLLNLQLDVSKAISYLSGMLIGFIGNKYWTFQSNLKTAREPIMYFIVYAATFFINIGCNRAAYSFFHDPQTGGMSDQIEKVLAFLIATGITTILNFLGMRFIAFRSGIIQRTINATQNAGSDGEA